MEPTGRFVVYSNSSALEKADQTTSYVLCAFDITLVGRRYAGNANRNRKKRDARISIYALVGCYHPEPIHRYLPEGFVNVRNIDFSASIDPTELYRSDSAPGQGYRVYMIDKIAKIWS